jgi:hypothetical protein
MFQYVKASGPIFLYLEVPIAAFVGWERARRPATHVATGIGAAVRDGAIVLAVVTALTALVVIAGAVGQAFVSHPAPHVRATQILPTLGALY